MRERGSVAFVVVGWFLATSCSNTHGAVAAPPTTWADSAVLTAAAEPVPVIPARHRVTAKSTFAVPPELRPAVDFWKDVFGTYSRRQVVVHDTVHLDRIYSVLDFRSLAAEGKSEGQIEQIAAQSVKREKERVRGLLRRLHRNGGQARTAEEKRIATMFHGQHGARKFLEAAAEDRVRAQAGIRERFGAGIEVGHRYFPEIEQIFRAEGVPVEISRLPLIESCFNVRAYSKRGAAGVWQFIPSTGRLFMRIDDVIDERRDPLLSARAAARFLKQNYEKLGAWPLAITAYNHGPAGMQRAVRTTGTTDIVKIIREYQGPAFKFASRNFYPEFLAALEVEREHQRHFGSLQLQDPVPTDTVTLRHFVYLDTFAQCAGVDPDQIIDLNPSLSRGVYEGKQRIPRGYELRIPAGARPRFEQRYAALPAAKKFDRQKQLYVVHRVRRGQTLGTIARRYGSTIERIRRYNNIRNTNLIRVGEVLRIPAS